MVSGALPNQGNGLGPRFNSNSCGSCHSQPYVGGSSPAQNPLMTIATAEGASNEIPWFITAHGPDPRGAIRQSNGVPDGGVHDLFVVSGRADAGSCAIQQPSFTPAGNPLTGHGGNSEHRVSHSDADLGRRLDRGHPGLGHPREHGGECRPQQPARRSGHANAILGGNTNLSANDGTITRFGWKAQNKSLLMFAGEAYNVEMGISNQLFPQERDETPNCQDQATRPTTPTTSPRRPTPVVATAVLSDIEAFADFMRMLAPPAPAPATTSTINRTRRLRQAWAARRATHPRSRPERRSHRAQREARAPRCPDRP